MTLKPRHILLLAIAALVLVMLVIVRRRAVGRRPAAPVTQAAGGAGDAGVSEADVMRALAEYQRLEAKKRRGQAFSRLALQLAQRRLAGASYTEADILRYLDTPDLCVGTPPRHRVFVYFYDNAGDQDWFVLVNFGDDGKVHEIGWNQRDANDFSHPAWHPFDSAATTQP